MLGFLTTDTAISEPLLRRALVEVVDETFNAITVDGDTSTNDAVVLLANGASGMTIGDAEYAFAFETRVGAHVFSLTFSNGPGTTFRQIAHGGVPERLNLGFNLTRKFF